jgi:transposase
MSFDRATLPRDPERLIELVMELQDRNTHLQGVVATLTRALYGPRSEKLIADTAQFPLALDDVVISEAPAAASDDIARQPDRACSSRPKMARNIGSLPKHLPRYEVVVDPESKVCPCCGGALHVIGEDVSEQLDVVPAVLRVQRVRRPRYGCRSCEGAVVQAKALPRLVENGMATTALVTSIVVAKFAWHLPLNRQTHMFRGHGIALDRSTLVDWVIRAAWWLRPLYTLLTDRVLATSKVFCDDTPMPVLDRRRRRTRTARFWSYATDDRPWQGPAPPIVVYIFAEDRKGRHVHEHLTGFSGPEQLQRADKIRSPEIAVVGMLHSPSLHVQRIAGESLIFTGQQIFSCSTPGPDNAWSCAHLGNHARMKIRMRHLATHSCVTRPHDESILPAGGRTMPPANPDGARVIDGVISQARSHR